MLDERESARYSRQMTLEGWGNAGQEKLKSRSETRVRPDPACPVCGKGEKR